LFVLFRAERRGIIFSRARSAIRRLVIIFYVFSCKRQARYEFNYEIDSSTSEILTI
jgi:hypothetical protein